MTYLLDNLGAIVISSVIGLIVLTLRIRSQELQTEALASYIVKTQTFDTAEWMHQDLTNIGWGRGPSEARMEAPTYDNAHHPFRLLASSGGGLDGRAEALRLRTAEHHDDPHRHG